MTDLEPLLAQNPFFAGISHEHLEVVVGCASNVVFKNGEYIFREKETARKFFIVRHGNVALEVFIPGRGPVTVLTVSEGEPIGWSWLVPPHEWHFDARCIGPVRALALDGECLRNKSESDPQFGYQLMNRISEMMEKRLRAMIMQLLDIYGSR